jgi:hypothetical protein
LIIIEKGSKFCVFKKNAYICKTEKTIKLTIMKKEIKVTEQRNYRVTIIVKDEIIVEKFSNERIAKETIKGMKEVVPELFIGGALEKKNKSWDVIWVLGNN